MQIGWAQKKIWTLADTILQIHLSNQFLLRHDHQSRQKQRVDTAEVTWSAQESNWVFAWVSATQSGKCHWDWNGCHEWRGDESCRRD